MVACGSGIVRCELEVVCAMRPLQRKEIKYVLNMVGHHKLLEIAV
jgi:hypothetical protein